MSRAYAGLDQTSLPMEAHVATSITPAIMLAALKKFGITPKFYRPDWATHNRTDVQGWGPLYGFLVHNFASDISDASSLDYLDRGDDARNLPGPLSQFAIADDGQVWIMGWGAANHAGTVDSDTHALIVKDAMPRDRDVKPNTSGSSTSGTVKGGPRYVGVEMLYGNKGPTRAQRASCVRLAAAMADMLGGTGGSVAGHRECTTTRSDPQFMPMGPFRREVDALIKKTNGGAAPAPTAPVPPLKENTNMAITATDVKAIWQADIIPSPDKEATNPSWRPDSYLREIFRQVRAGRDENRARNEAMMAAITALASAQGVDPEKVAGVVEAAVKERLASLRFDVTDASA